MTLDVQSVLFFFGLFFLTVTTTFFAYRLANALSDA